MRRLLVALAFTAAAGAAQAQMLAPDFDADHDGKVTLQEFRAGQGKVIDRMFARLDANKDGKVTQDEIAAMRAKNPRAAARIGSGGRMLTLLDTDKDGWVSRSEMAGMADRRFAAADINHDGWLSKDELAMMRQNRDREAN